MLFTRMALLQLVLLLSTLAAVVAQPRAADLNLADYTCPTNYVPTLIPAFFPPYNNVSCAPNPCYGNPGPCGLGGNCTVEVQQVSRGAYNFRSICQCQPPAVVSGSPAGSGLTLPQFCFVPGADSCNPDPCKNNATCFTSPDYPQDMNTSEVNTGFFFCQCPPDWQGTTCELPVPSPPATLDLAPHPAAAVPVAFPPTPVPPTAASAPSPAAANNAPQPVAGPAASPIPPPNPCRNGGTPRISGGCQCPNGYTGPTCEVPVLGGNPYATS